MSKLLLRYQYKKFFAAHIATSVDAAGSCIVNNVSVGFNALDKKVIGFRQTESILPEFAIQVICFNLNSRESLNEAKRIYDSFISTNNGVPIFFVATQMYLEHKVSAQDIADVLGEDITVYETSAMTGEGVERAFLAIARYLTMPSLLAASRRTTTASSVNEVPETPISSTSMRPGASS